MHNLLGVPSAGARFQEEGLLVSINELALALTVATLFGTVLLDFERELRQEILGEVRKLAEFIGGATITDIDGYRESVLSDPAARDELERVGAALRRAQAERHSNGLRGSDSGSKDTD